MPGDSRKPSNGTHSPGRSAQHAASPTPNAVDSRSQASAWARSWIKRAASDATTRC